MSIPRSTEQAAAVEVGRVRADVVLVLPQSVLDAAVVSEVRRVVDEQLDTDPWAIVLDLSAVADLPPMAVDALVAIAERAGDADVGLCLVATDDVVPFALEAADRLDLFEIYPTANRALHAMGAPRATG